VEGEGFGELLSDGAEELTEDARTEPRSRMVADARLIPTDRIQSPMPSEMTP
jgi:hypothetical protein